MGMIMMGALIPIICGTRCTTAERIISNGTIVIRSIGKRIIIRLESDKVEAEIFVDEVVSYKASKRRTGDGSQAVLSIAVYALPRLFSWWRLAIRRTSSTTRDGSDCTFGDIYAVDGAKNIERTIPSMLAFPGLACLPAPTEHLQFWS